MKEKTDGCVIEMDAETARSFRVMGVKRREKKK